MATNFRWSLATVVVLVVVAPGRFASAGEPGPVVTGGVEYRVEQSSGTPVRATVKAIDPKTSAELWRVQLYEGSTRGDVFKTRDDPKVVELTAFAGGLVASTDDRATFFVDPGTRKVELVRDMRGKVASCPVHHRPTIGYLAPIHYGLGRQTALTKGQRDKFPLADHAVEAGCCVMPEKIAILDRCPDCH